MSRKSNKLPRRALQVAASAVRAAPIFEVLDDLALARLALLRARFAIELATGALTHAALSGAKSTARRRRATRRRT